jgi:hypothetical protein
VAARTRPTQSIIRRAGLPPSSEAHRLFILDVPLRSGQPSDVDVLAGQLTFWLLTVVYVLSQYGQSKAESESSLDKPASTGVAPCMSDGLFVCFAMLM